MSDDKKKMLVWFNLETTGLDAKRDAILEVGFAFATFENPFAPTTRFAQVIQFEKINRATSAIDPYVDAMHEKNGLWDACHRSTTSLWSVEQQLGNALVDLKREHDLFLAGSTVHFNRAFVRELMPTLDKHLHHRHYDVSSIKLFCESMGMEKIAKGEAHRAAADIDESIAHAKHCAEWLRTNGRG